MPTEKNTQSESRSFRAFLLDEEGQDFAEYALLLGAIAVVALAVINLYKEELLRAFQNAISALQAANG